MDPKEYKLWVKAPEDIIDDVVEQLKDYASEMWDDEVEISKSE